MDKRRGGARRANAARMGGTRCPVVFGNRQLSVHAIDQSNIRARIAAKGREAGPLS
jgi:hypothetical protein